MTMPQQLYAVADTSVQKSGFTYFHLARQRGITKSKLTFSLVVEITSEEIIQVLKELEA